MKVSEAMRLAEEHHRAGRLMEAEKLYRAVLRTQPRNAEALQLLGMLAGQVGKMDASVDLIRQAIALDAGKSLYYQNLGTALSAMGKRDEAMEAFRRAIELEPGNAELHRKLADELTACKRSDEGIESYRRALALRPDDGASHNNLGNAYSDKDEMDQAVACYRRAGELMPDSAEVLSNLGSALAGQGEMEAAIAAHRRCLELSPENAEAHWNFAVMLLSMGRFAEGWEEFEWRLRVARMKLDRDFPQPKWDGGDLAGRTILMHTEGGFGDAIQFIRLIPLARGRAQRVVLECQAELVRLFTGAAGVDECAARGQSLPAFDCRIALQSLPRILGIDQETIPSAVPYLRAPGEAVDYWRGRIPRDGVKNVGLCWAGSRAVGDHRSRTIEIFAPLAKITGVRFFSLQNGPDGKQTPPAGMELIDHTGELRDFADMAGLVENLDLVISVDTSIAHLAGALGKPVWVLVPSRADFRWLRARADSPWYPTMRLYRQRKLGEWAETAARVAEELRGLP